MEAMLGNRSINAYLVRLEIDGEIAAPSKVSADIIDKAAKLISLGPANAVTSCIVTAPCSSRNVN